MKQSEIFIHGEGAAWWERNKHKLPPEDDPVLDAIQTARMRPKNVLEVGCSNGWRLLHLQARYGCNIVGIEPAAVPEYGAHVWRGTADNIPRMDAEFDVVIYGFCLYLVDRQDLFKVVAECDRVLQEGGYVVIHDFSTAVPHAVPYHHKAGVMTYKMNYADLWVGNPAYRHVYQQKRFDPSGDGHTSVVVLRKSNKLIWGSGV